MVLTDLREFIPDNYFSGEVETFKFHEGIPNAAHWSSEMRWGFLAGNLSRELFFHSTAIMTARQTSAAEVLMNLGMLAAAEAAQGVSQQLAILATVRGVADGNAGAVAAQLRAEHIPTLANNIRVGLKRYLRYLTHFEAEPFLPLLEKVPMKSQDQPAGQPTFIIHGNVGAIQTAPNAVAHVQQIVVEKDFGVLGDALAQLRLAIPVLHGLDINLRERLAVDISAAETEIKRNVKDETALLKWLAGIGAVVQTLGSAQPAWEAVRAAARSVGLPL